MSVFCSSTSVRFIASSFPRNGTCHLAILAILCSWVTNVSAMPRIGTQEDTEEIWFGLIITPGPHLRTVLKLKKDATGYTGFAYSPDQTLDPIKLDSVTIADGKMKFSSKTLRARFEGKLSADQKSVEGKFVQGAGSYQLKLKKVAAMPPFEPYEVWNGVLKVGATKLRLQYRVFRNPDGRDHILLDSLDQNIKGIYTKKTETKDKIELACDMLKAKFEGTLDKTKQVISGQWKQGGQSIPLELKRNVVAKKVEAPKRPQTPKGPFPYRSQEVDFSGGAAGVRLAGTLLIPKNSADAKNTDAKYAAVVLVSGSGPQDRDETLLGHKPFLVIADHLARKGIAVLRYDDRGVAKSTGDFSTGTSFDFAADAAAAVKFLRGVPEIDARQIGIVGHSEGGLIAPIVASKDKQLGFIVMLAGPGVNGRKILVSQTALIARAAGVSETDISRSQEANRIAFDTLLSLPKGLESKEMIERIAEQMEKELSPESVKEIFNIEGDTPVERLSLEMKTGLGSLVGPWFRNFLIYDPATHLKTVTCPVLAINGAMDTQVDPKLNLPPIRAALKAGGNRDVTCLELDGMNHLFQECKTGAIQEYSTIEQTFSPKALKTLSDWISKRVR